MSLINYAQASNRFLVVFYKRQLAMNNDLWAVQQAALT